VTKAKPVRDVQVGPRTAALLRAINVGGNNRIKMADLRALLEGLGHTDVETYLQSGNVAFTPADPKAKESAVRAQLEQAVTDEFGLTIDVMVRTHRELAAVLALHPFGDRTDDPKQLHVSFLHEVPEPERAKSLEPPAGEDIELAVHGRELYLYTPQGLGRTKLSSAVIDRKLGVRGTARNWRTVAELTKLTEGS
jgi:uncharacterized protein (DUF1697 family)